MTMTQFEKRKLKELEAEVEEKREAKREKKAQKAEVELNERAYDIINIEGRPHIIIIAYDVESQTSKIEVVTPINKSVALPFANKKKALQTLTRDLYKLEK